MNISFSATARQILNRTKTVTRRLGWARLKPGQVLTACLKCQGLKKGEKVQKLCRIRVKSVRTEPLNGLLDRRCYSAGAANFEIVQEGLNMSPKDFVDFFCWLNKCKPTKRVRVIVFEYLD